MHNKQFYVYILNNYTKTTLYCGITKNAIEREKQIKNYSRKKKEEMIMKFNPKVVDLFNSIL